MTMKSFLLKLCTVALLGSTVAATTVQAAELHVMSSGGFTAAYKVLGPRFSAATGNTLDTALGPSMGKSPEAIPNRLERGEPADVVIMVGYALDDLIKQGKVIPGSRVELADSRIGMVVREGAPKPDIGTVEALKADAAACEVDRVLRQRERRLYRARVVQAARHRRAGEVQGEDGPEDSGGLSRGQRRLRSGLPAGERTAPGEGRRPSSGRFRSRCNPSRALPPGFRLARSIRRKRKRCSTISHRPTCSLK